MARQFGKRQAILAGINTFECYPSEKWWLIVVQTPMVWMLKR
jgi:hypothetical protein